MKWCKRAVLVLTALMAFGIPLVGTASASEVLSYVGPTLSSNPSKAKVQVATMLHHDRAVQAFYAGSLNVSMADIASANVTDLKFGHCRIGVNPKCPINTGKDGAGNIKKTDYRFGEVRKVAYVTIEIGKALFSITLEAPCVNLLNGGVRIHEVVPPRPPRPPHIPVSPKKPITFQLVSTSYSVSESSSSATAVCPAGTVASYAGSGAGAEAEAKATYKVYRQKRHSWASLYSQINAISTTTYTITGTNTSVTCTPAPPPPTCTPGTPECSPPSSCTTNPEQKQCKPTVILEEEINDMEVSRNGHHHKRYICFYAYPGVGSSLSDLEVKLQPHYGVTLSPAEYKGGNEFCQWYETGSEPVTESIRGWARDKKTGAIGESEPITFPVNLETTY